MAVRYLDELYPSRSILRTYSRNSEKFISSGGLSAMRKSAGVSGREMTSCSWNFRAGNPPGGKEVSEASVKVHRPSCQRALRHRSASTN